MTIRELRMARSLTQQQVADGVGVTSRTVASWEAGGHTPERLRAKVAGYFGVKMDDLWPVEPAKGGK